MSNKHVAAAFYRESPGDVPGGFQKYVAPAVINHALDGTAHTRDTWRDYDIAFYAAFTDIDVDVLDQIAEGDKVATRWVLSGTQIAEFGGIRSRGRTAHLRATTIDRLLEGLIVEHWIDVDFSSFMAQLNSD